MFNRGARQWPIYRTDSDRSAFVALLATLRAEFGLEIHAFSLMDNHYHLVVRDPDDCLSRAIGYLGQRFTQQFNAAHEVDGPLFRGRFGSVPVTSDRQLITAIRYVALNPLDLASIQSLEAYRWSSHRSYLGLRATPGWLCTDTVLALTGGVEGYRRLIEAGMPRADSPPSVSLARIEHAVLSATGTIRSDLMKAARGRRNVPRLLLVLAVAEPESRASPGCGAPSNK